MGLVAMSLCVRTSLGKLCIEIFMHTYILRPLKIWKLKRTLKELVKFAVAIMLKDICPQVKNGSFDYAYRCQPLASGRIPQSQGMNFALGQTSIALSCDKEMARFHGLFDVGCASEIYADVSLVPDATRGRLLSNAKKPPISVLSFYC